MNRADFLGVWSLVDFSMYTGSVRERPFGEKPRGRLHLADNGEMLVALFAEERPTVPSGDMAAVEPDQATQLLASAVSYFGRWSLDPSGPSLVTRVEGALFPNWDGTTQARIPRFVDRDSLVLETPPIPWQGKTKRGSLVWRKLP